MVEVQLRWYAGAGLTTRGQGGMDAACIFCRGKSPSTRDRRPRDHRCLFRIVFGIGMYFSLKERSSEDYFLAAAILDGFSSALLVRIEYFTEHFIGLSGTGASSDWQSAILSGWRASSC